MTAPKRIKIGRDTFVMGIETCWDCSDDFSFCVPANVYLFWDRLCYRCGTYEQNMKEMKLWE